ncbi:MAG: quinone oxidoreductase [Gammaproteobacteria bacterium]|nr:MAG: quinone oxidoreductase [Gammaproteobacteria bacterium]
MRAIQVRRYGGPEELVEWELGTPEPGPGEALVCISHAGVNFTDIYTRQGVYRHSQTYRNQPPFIPGMEATGVVDSVGDGVENVVPGDRVAYCLSLGAYAEYAVVPAWRLVTVPGGLAPTLAVGLMLQGCTAHYLTHSLFALESGQVCLVHAAAGGVGQLLLQLARLRGARAIATVGNEEKAAIAKELGADPVIRYHEEKFDDAVLEATDGRGVDVVYDGVGRSTFSGSLRSLRPRGTLALFGGASGAVESVTPLDLAEAGSLFFTRPHMADYMASSEEIAWRAGDMFRFAAQGDIKVRIDRQFPLLQAGEAHRVMEQGGTRGKLLLCMTDAE